MRTVALDLETTGLKYYLPDFRVTDLALSYRDDDGLMVSIHVQGHDEVGEALRSLADKDVTIVCHNATYDIGVLQACYPEVKFDNWYCTQRLCQVGDAGIINKFYQDRYDRQGGNKLEGLSLVACCSRWLRRVYHDHKREAHRWIADNIGEDVKPGEHLSKLPKDIMKRYNCGDTENTLRLYEEVVKQFEVDGYTGYELDHSLYRGRVQQLINAYIEGVKLDIDKLKQCILKTDLKLVKMERDFREVHKEDIKKVIEIKQQAYILDPTVKTDRGRASRQKRIDEGGTFAAFDQICKFNIGSTKDLFLLYNGVLNIDTPFYTKPDKDGNGGNSPSFKKAHLPAWHDSGRILQDRGTLRIIKKQAESLLILGEEDGRYHVSMNATATKTGRLSGRDGGR